MSKIKPKEKIIQSTRELIEQKINLKEIFILNLTIRIDSEVFNPSTFFNCASKEASGELDEKSRLKNCTELRLNIFLQLHRRYALQNQRYCSMQHVPFFFVPD